MIRVSKVYTEATGTLVRLYADYEVDGVCGQLWYEVEAEFAQYLSAECGDSFFVVLVLLAHTRGQDIVFESTVSRRLHYGVTEVLLPALRIISPDSPVIAVNVEKKDFSFSPLGIGTALSLGVDSFHALASSHAGPYPVTHLALFNSGAFGDNGGDASRAMFRLTAKRVALAAAEMKLPLVLVDSNLSEVLQGPFINTHSIRNLSCALLFPGLFKVFYYASTYPAKDFTLHKSLVDAACYDLLTAKALCTESCEVLIAGLHEERVAKIAVVSGFSPSIRSLNVCVLAESNLHLDKSDDDVKNCSRCFKCVKTMVALDLIGSLDAYVAVFNLELYRAERSRYLGWILYDALKLKSAHAIEIVRDSRERPGFFPPAAYWHAFRRGVSNLVRRISRKRVHLCA